jgi:hypothetical protein
MNRYFRESKWQLAKSAYAIVINPWDSQEDTEAVLLWRGAIVSSFAYVETRLAELAITISRLPDYAGLRTTYPRRLDSRRAYLRQAFSFGPLAPYERLAMGILDRFERAGDLRHLMAHAAMDIGGPLGARFSDFPESDGIAITQRLELMPLAKLEREAWRSARFSRLVQRLLYSLEERVLAQLR